METDDKSDILCLEIRTTDRSQSARPKSAQRATSRPMRESLPAEQENVDTLLNNESRKGVNESNSQAVSNLPKIQVKNEVKSKGFKIFDPFPVIPKAKKHSGKKSERPKCKLLPKAQTSISKSAKIVHSEINHNLLSRSKSSACISFDKFGYNQRENDIHKPSQGLPSLSKRFSLTGGEEKDVNKLFTKRKKSLNELKLVDSQRVFSNQESSKIIESLEKRKISTKPLRNKDENNPASIAEIKSILETDLIEIRDIKSCLVIGKKSSDGTENLNAASCSVLDKQIIANSCNQKQNTQFEQRTKQEIDKLIGIDSTEQLPARNAKRKQSEAGVPNAEEYPILVWDNFQTRAVLAKVIVSTLLLYITNVYIY